MSARFLPSDEVPFMKTPQVVANRPSPDKFKGIDIMRAPRGFDPRLPCGVHIYLGQDKTLEVMHTPTALMGLAK